MMHLNELFGHECLNKNQIVDVFKMATPVCSRLHFDLIKHFTQKPFIFKNNVFAFLTPPPPPPPPPQKKKKKKNEEEKRKLF